MDKNEKAELRGFIVNTIRATLREQNERWLTKEQLCEQFGMFTPSWLKMYGHLLPQQQAIVTDSDGRQYKSRTAFPMYRIQEMVMSGEIKDLEMKARN